MRFDSWRMVLVVGLTSAACYSMQQVTLAELGSAKTRVWVTQPDKTVVQLDDAQAFRGKLVGFANGTYLELAPENLQGMQVRKLSAGRTIGLVAVGIGAFAAGVVLVSGSEDHFDECIGDDECEDA